jgi:two-component system, chemotaxis family, response regulator WspF
VRIAIVNDLAMAREALRRAVAALPDSTVAWTAADGAEAIDKAQRDRPDLILMDLIMPGTDGVEATRQIMRRCPCAIVVVTATVEGNASRVYEALSAGALDAMDTPRVGEGGSARLAQKIAEVQRIRAQGARPATAHGLSSAPPSPLSAPGQAPLPTAGTPSGAAAPRSPISPCCADPSGRIPVVAIGASTGGPQALATVLAGLPRDAAFATLIVQHMEAVFLPGLAAWLSDRIGRPVELATPGHAPSPGEILIAGRPQQLIVVGRGTLCYSPGDPEAVHRPSVDALFESLADSLVEPGAAALLTGMGRDGARGLLRLRQHGWTTVAQDQASSVVWGMPGAAVELQAASRVLPLPLIGPALAAAMNERLSHPSKGQP